MEKIGFDRLRRKFARMAPEIRAELEQANKDNAELIVDVAKALVPQGETGRARSAIRNNEAADGSQEVKFGSLARILEGGTKPRFTKSGASRGVGPKRPFVNPAIQGTKRKRAARNRKAMRDALKKLDGS